MEADIPPDGPPSYSTSLDPQPITKDEVAAFISRGDDALFDLDRADAEDSFAEFVKQAWHVIDPQTKLVWGWVMDAICLHLQAVTERRLRKVLLNVPPGTCKTLLTCVFWPAWEWGARNMPGNRYIKASYAERLSLEANLKLRRLVKSEWYQKRWGDRVTIADDQDSKIRFGTTMAGWSLAMSVDGATIGERGDRFIIDDPHNTMEAESDIEREKAVKWMFEAASTRHNNPADKVEIIIMQRLHEGDCSGAILAHPSYFGFTHVCIEMEFDPDHPVARRFPSPIGWADPRTLLPPDEQLGALCWPERYTREAVEEQKEKFRGDGISLYAEAGQFGQYPIGRKGAMFDWEAAKVVEMLDLVKLGFPMQVKHGVVRGWDLAGSTRKTSPFTAAPAMVKWAGKIVVLDVVHERIDSSMIDGLIERVADEDDVKWGGVKQSLPQDPGQAGKAQVSHLAGGALAGHSFSFSLESGDKEIRAIPWASQWNAGNVILVKGAWNAKYIQEHKMFPAGRLKDQVDGSSRAYAELLTVKELPPPFGGACLDLSENDDGQWSYEQ
jgi:predicted phage terminase large subunit-like protein